MRLKLFTLLFTYFRMVQVFAGGVIRSYKHSIAQAKDEGIQINTDCNTDDYCQVEIIVPQLRASEVLQRVSLSGEEFLYFHGGKTRRS